MIGIADNWSPAVLRRHSSYLLGRVAEAMDSDLDLGDVARAFVRCHLSAIVHGAPSGLREVIASAEVLKKALKKDQYERFLKDCSLIFDYEAFSRRDLPNWGAYALCVESRYTMCPYCHQAFAHTLIPKGAGRFRPTLDHYYAKNKYPYLALSIYNLVPSCYTCNSQLKGCRDFYRERHLHPYEEVDGSIECVFDIREYLRRRVVGQGRYEVVIRDKSHAASRSISCFALDRRFSINERYLDSYVARVMDYVVGKEGRGAYRARIGFDLSEADLIGFDSANYKNEMLGKIKLDLYALVLVM